MTRALAQVSRNLGRLARLRSCPACRQSTTSILRSRTFATASSSKELKDALLEVNRVAGIYVNISRLQLAINGVESPRPITRVAVLGLNGQAKARRLVRALLADPLADESEWERYLDATNDGRGLLIRHGESFQVTTNNPLVITMYINSSFLKRHSIEFLINSFKIGSHIKDSPSHERLSAEDSLLTQALETPASSSGRFATVTYPVHKAVIVGDDAQSLLNLGRYSSRFSGSLPEETIKIVSTNTGIAASANQVDTDLAVRAVGLLRASLDNSIAFEKDWFRSGAAELTSWITRGTEPEAKDTVVSLTRSVLEGTFDKISAEQRRALERTRSESVNPRTITQLQKSLALWAERAHFELRNQLDQGFASRRWNTMKWWKLFWRTDDIPLVTSELLDGRFLNQAEKEMIFLMGQLYQAEVLKRPATPGQRGDEVSPFLKSSESALASGKIGSTPETLVTMRDFFPSHLQFKDTLLLNENQPWPQGIEITRTQLRDIFTLPLHRKAQSLILSTTATSGIFSALSVLTYLSTSFSMFEASGIALTGIVFSLGRLQRRWEKVTLEWEEQVREEGRKAIRDSESNISSVLLASEASGKKGLAELDGAKERAIALKAVEDAVVALEKSIE